MTTDVNIDVKQKILGEIDIPTLDIKTPKSLKKGEISTPEIEIKVPDVKLPSVGIDVSKVDLNSTKDSKVEYIQPSKVDINVSNLKRPSLDINISKVDDETSDLSKQSDTHVVSTSNIEFDETDISLDRGNSPLKGDSVTESLSSNEGSTSFMSKLRKGLKMSNVKSNKKTKEQKADNSIEIDDQTKIDLSTFLDKERENTDLLKISPINEPSSSVILDISSRIPTDRIDDSGPQISGHTVFNSSTVNTRTTRRIIRRIIVINGKQTELEEIIDEPQTGESIRKIVKKTSQDGGPIIEEEIQPEEMERLISEAVTDNVIVSENLKNEVIESSEQKVITISKRSKIIRRRVVIDGVEKVIEEVVDDSETEAGDLIKDGSDILEIIESPHLVINVSDLPKIGDGKNDYKYTSTVTNRRKIQRIIFVDGVEKVIDEEIDEPFVTETSQQTKTNTGDDTMFNVSSNEETHKNDLYVTSNTDSLSLTGNNYPTETITTEYHVSDSDNISTTNIPVVDDGVSHILSEESSNIEGISDIDASKSQSFLGKLIDLLGHPNKVLDPGKVNRSNTNLQSNSNMTDFLQNERDHFVPIHKIENDNSNDERISQEFILSSKASHFVDENAPNVKVHKNIVRKLVDKDGIKQLVFEVNDQPSSKTKTLKLNNSIDSSNHLINMRNNIIKSDNKNKYSLYKMFFEEILELLEIITFHTTKKDKCSEADLELNLEEPIQAKQILGQIESVINDVSKVKEKNIGSKEDYENIKAIIEQLQSKTNEVKIHIDNFKENGDSVDWQKHNLSLENTNKKIEQLKTDYDQLKKGKLSYTEKLHKMEELFSCNHTCVEDLYNIISISKVKYSSKNKLPDDVHKSLKFAIKLEKEIRNSIKYIIEDIEKESSINSNSKQLQLVFESVKSSFINSDKYYNIKHVQEDYDKYHHSATKLIGLKSILETQKTDKNIVKKLDTELNNILLNQKKLLTIQNEWTRFDDILTAEQKWLDEVGVSILDLTKTSSNNYISTLSTTQNTIAEVAIHYDKLVYLKGIIEKLQDQIDVKPLLYICEQHTNDTFKLKNNLRAKEIRLIAFKKTFDKYHNLKTSIESSLLQIKSNLENIPPNQEISDNNMIRYELEILEEYLKTCSNNLNESLDILPISDGQSEIESIGVLSTECRTLKDKFYKSGFATESEEFSKIFKHLDTVVNKPKDTLLDHIKALKGVLYEINAIESFEKDQQTFEQLNAFQNKCNDQLTDYSALNNKIETFRDCLHDLTDNMNNSDLTLSELEIESVKDRHTAETALNKTYHQVSDNMKNIQQTLVSASQQLKQLKENLKLFKKDKKTLESELGEIEKRYKQLKTKHQNLHKTLENKCNYWIMIDELLLKIRTKYNHVNNLTQITPDAETIVDKHLEVMLKNLKDVRSSYDKENKSILADIENIRKKGDKQQIDELIDNDLKQWTDTGVAIKQSIDQYEKATKTLQNYQQLKESTNDCLNAKLLSIETTEDVSEKTKSIEKEKENLVELRNMITDVAEIIGLNPDDVPLNEIEELSLKLEKVQKVLTTLGDVSAKKNKMTNDLEDAKRLLNDIEKNSSKSIKNNDEDLKELRNKLLDLNKSKKVIDESFDIDKFEMPLSEKRTYSIIEVFQLWQQIFKETFQQYRRLSCSLLENENNDAVFELWRDYLICVQEFLKSPIPGDYHSLTSHERLCQVHQEVLISQMDTIPNFINKPDIISEPVAMEKCTSLIDLHNETMTKLENTHQEVWTKLGHWKEYRTNVKRVYEWLWKIEKAHSNLNLKFINSRRLPQLKAQITNLLNNLTEERSQVDDLEHRQNTIFSFCDKSTETGHRKELIAISQRINEIQASLEVWNGYLENIEKLTSSFDVQSTEIDKVLQDVQANLEFLQHEFNSKHEDIVPSDKLNTESQKIQKLNNQLKQLDEQLSSTTDIRDKLKDSLDPIEIRSFGQRLRFLKYHQKDLQYQLFLYSCQIDNLLYKPQEFTHRFTRFINWATDTETQLKNLTKSLKDPKFAIDVLKPEFESQINLKQKEFKWLNEAGNQLITAESQINPELASTTEFNLKEVNESWNNLNNSLHKYTVELPTIILNTNKLFNEINIFKTWISDLESKINNPIVFNDRSESNLKEELKTIDTLTKIYKENQGQFDELINKCNEQLKVDNSSSDSDISQDIQCQLNTLPISWKNLEVKIKDKQVRVLSAWEELQTILGLIDVETKWLNRLNSTVEEHEKQNFTEHKSLSGLISNFEQEEQNSKDKFSKLELAVSISRSTYTAKFIDDEIQIISKNKESLSQKINSILVVLKKSLALWKDFINAHGRAVVTLTQVDTKLIQLELLEKADSDDKGNTRLMEKDLGNLQILEMELKKYGGLLEKADALGLQLMTESTPGDIKNIQEMIDEYQILWKDINNRIEKLKVTCVQETSCRKKRSVNEEVQVETLKFGKDSEVQVDTLPTELLRKDSFLYELQTAIANATTNLNELELAIQKSDKNLSKNIATCQMSIDLIKHLSVILKTQCGVPESDTTVVRSKELLAKYDELLAEFRSQQQVGASRSNNSGLCTLCPEENRRSQFENDMWRLEHWIQSTEAKLSVQPMVPPSKIEQLEDVIQEHRELLLYLDSHRNIVQSLNVIGQHLAEHSDDIERTTEIKNRLSATNSRWDHVCFACTEWQTKLQTALMENDEFYGVIDELVTWLDETERTIKTTEPVNLAEDTVVIMEKFNKFKKLHAELERCEPRVVSLLEAADWLRQANEKTGAVRVASTSAAATAAAAAGSPSDRQAAAAVVDSHARLSHLRTRLTALINMTGSHTAALGAVLGYDAASARDAACLRLHQVDDTSTVMNRSDEEEPNTNVGGDETVLRRGYRFFGRVMRASLPFQVLMLLVLGAASLVPIVDEEFSCMESNNIAWSLYPLLRYPGGPPPV